MSGFWWLCGCLNWRETALGVCVCVWGLRSVFVVGDWEYGWRKEERTSFLGAQTKERLISLENIRWVFVKAQKMDFCKNYQSCRKATAVLFTCRKRQRKIPLSLSTSLCSFCFCGWRSPDWLILGKRATSIKK